MQPVWLTDTITPDLSRSIHYTLLWGLEGVVLRSVEGAIVPEVNEAKLKKRLGAAALEVAAVDPGVFDAAPSERVVWLNDLERLDETAAFCRRIGCRRVIAGSLPGGELAAAAETLRRAADRLRPHTVSLCIRNAGPGRATAAQLHDLLRLADREEILTCWDPAHALEVMGEAALEGAAVLAGSLGLVVVRDLGLTGARWGPSPLGEGAVGWAEVLRTLAAAGYTGPLCLEFRGAAPHHALRDATTLIQLVRQAHATA